MPKRSGNRRQEVVQLLEDAVLGGKLPPGTHLPEMRIAREIGVSQAIVREALQELEARGLILKQANQGSRVVELNSDDLIAIYQVRRELEPLAFMFASQAMTQSHFNALETCIEQMHHTGSVHDFRHYSQADIRFHRTVWSLQPNRYLERSLEAVCLPLFVYDQITRADTSALDFELVTQQHQIILTAMRLRDAEFVRRLVSRLMQRWMRIHLEDFRRYPHHESNMHRPSPFEMLHQMAQERNL